MNATKAAVRESSGGSKLRSADESSGAPPDHVGWDPSERLRVQGIDSAAMILTEPHLWKDAADWLKTLPMCWAIEEVPSRHVAPDDSRVPRLIVDLDELPIGSDTPMSQRHHVYDYEAEKNLIWGPDLRRLMTAWNAATYRFLHTQRGDDCYYDFGMDDARRITLLAALTLNRDFDGSAVGLGIAWEHSANCGPSFEGRGWTWSAMTSGLFAEKTLNVVISVATDYLFRMTRKAEQLPERITTQPTGTLPPEKMTWCETQGRLFEIYDRGDEYTSISDLAKRLGCSYGTVQKAIKPKQSSLDRLDEEDRIKAISVAQKLAGWQARFSKKNGASRATSLNDVIADNAEQTRESDPAKEAEMNDENDVIFSRLVQEAETGEERAQLNALSPKQRRIIVAENRYNSDLGNPILNRRL